jgi:hypothetical protein
MESPICNLYHGTLVQNSETIKEQGLLPRSGSVTTDYHDNAVGLVYAVDESRKGSLIRIIIQQMINSCLIQWVDDYQFDDFKRDMREHGMILVLKADCFCFCPNDVEALSRPSKCPKGVEPGDWYSYERVTPEAEMKGQEMLDWLEITELSFTHDYRELLRRKFTRETQTKFVSDVARVLSGEPPARPVKI